MKKFDETQLRLLAEVADLHKIPEGAYNIRSNSGMAARNTTANIDIVSKTDVSGMDIYIKPGTQKESVHIPVVLSTAGLKEMVYNDFFVGDDADVTIIAGCGIHKPVRSHRGDGVLHLLRHTGNGKGRGLDSHRKTL